jgi:uncharacterized protein (TIGR02145 family)
MSNSINKIINIFFSLFIVSSLSAQSEIKIGKLTWMTKNLNTNTFRNGDVITHALSREEWNRASLNKEPAWCYYENYSLNGITYGKLYNWYAVNDPRGLAPKGWRIATEEDFAYLIDFLGSYYQGLCNNDSGKKMKSPNEWANDSKGNNSSAWSGYPGGLRQRRHPYNDALGAEFIYKGKSGFWWVSNEGEYSQTNSIELSSVETTCDRKMDYGTGLSVRCVKN